MRFDRERSAVPSLIASNETKKEKILTDRLSTYRIHNTRILLKQT